MARTATINRRTAETDIQLTLDVDGTTRQLAYAEVAKALVQVEFNRKDSSTATGAGEDT